MNGLDPEPTPTRPATPQCRSCGATSAVNRPWSRRVMVHRGRRSPGEVNRLGCQLGCQRRTPSLIPKWRD